MSQVRKMMREVAADFFAAIMAAAAVRAHRAPPKNALKQLGIREQDFAGLRY